MIKTDKEIFEANPDIFIEKTISNYVATSLENRLPGFQNERIFEQPIIGFCDGDDPCFKEYKTIIGDLHLTPREVLSLGLQQKGLEVNNQPSPVSVIVWALPMTQETRKSMRKEVQLSSLRWNYTRWYGQNFNDNLAREIARLIEGFGYIAVIPTLEDFFKNSENTSNWSIRHVAYLAGLGTFGLNHGFITQKGISVRLNSLVTNVPFCASRKIHENHLANCLFYQNSTCGKCMQRCPVSAISTSGLDKHKCYDYIVNQLPLLLKEQGKEGYVGSNPSCGLCYTKIPCEETIPVTFKLPH